MRTSMAYVIMALFTACAGVPPQAQAEPAISHMEVLARVSRLGSIEGGFSSIDIQDLTVDELRFQYQWPGDGLSLGQVVNALEFQAQSKLPVEATARRAADTTRPGKEIARTVVIPPATTVAITPSTIPGPRWSYHPAQNVVVTSGRASRILTYVVQPGRYEGTICGIVDDLTKGATPQTGAPAPLRGFCAYQPIQLPGTFKPVDGQYKLILEAGVTLERALAMLLGAKDVRLALSATVRNVPSGVSVHWLALGRLNDADGDNK